MHKASMTNTGCYTIFVPKTTDLSTFLESLKIESIINSGASPCNLEIRNDGEQTQINFTLTVCVDNMDDWEIDQEFDIIREYLTENLKFDVILDDVLIDD